MKYQIGAAGHSLYFSPLFLHNVFESADVLVIFSVCMKSVLRSLSRRTTHSQKKRHKSCLWGGAFSKGMLLNLIYS